MFFPNGIGSTEIVTAKSSEMNIMIPKPGTQDLVSHIQYLVVTLTLATFRSNYEDEIEYEDDFSNLVSLLKIIACYTKLVPKASFSTGK